MKISIIGAGSVGATTAYTLMIKNIVSDIILVDINKEKEEGEVLDISDGLSFSKTGSIKTGDYKDVKDSDIIILTAGLPQKPGETRLDLADKNKKIAKSIFKNIGKIKSSCIIIIVSNPVDVITYLVQEISGLPYNQVFGTGTCLDTARLRSNLAEHFTVDATQIEGFLLGEHGDSEFVAWSTVNIEGKLVSNLLNNKEMDIIEDEIKNEAYEIINRKGATFYGIATVIADIVEAIIFDQNKILPVSSRYNNPNDDIPKICFGNPCVIGNKGIMKYWTVKLTKEEKDKLRKSAEKIKEYL